MTPYTVDDWVTYIATLSGVELRRKALAANTIAFVTTLKGEGRSGREIADVLVAFALQLKRDGQMPPVGGPGQYLSYTDVIEEIERR